MCNDMQVLESYDMAYSNMVRVQQFSELEEVSKCSWMPHPPRTSSLIHQQQIS
jgi:hypothetical protein